MNKNLVWSTDITTLLEIFDLARCHGKKPGNNVQEEFLEIYKLKPDKFQILGETNKDLDLLCGNMREEGLKILNLNENKKEIK
jgi:hypothetical protein